MNGFGENNNEEASLALDNLPERISKETEVDLKDTYKYFNIFKQWYEKRTDCSSEEVVNLNHMKTVLQSAVYEKYYANR